MFVAAPWGWFLSFFPPSPTRAPVIKLACMSCARTFPQNLFESAARSNGVPFADAALDPVAFRQYLRSHGENAPCLRLRDTGFPVSGNK